MHRSGDIACLQPLFLCRTAALLLLAVTVRSCTSIKDDSIMHHSCLVGDASTKHLKRLPLACPLCESIIMSVAAPGINTRESGSVCRAHNKHPDTQKKKSLEVSRPTPVTQIERPPGYFVYIPIIQPTAPVASALKNCFYLVPYWATWSCINRAFYDLFLLVGFLLFIPRATAAAF
jgi:hypothetical protein